jgi:hypothetical protein
MVHWRAAALQTTYTVGRIGTGTFDPLAVVVETAKFTMIRITTTKTSNPVMV